MIIALSTLFILGTVGVLFLNQAKFGRIPQGKRLERIKQSPHYDGQKFVNSCSAKGRKPFPIQR